MKFEAKISGTKVTDFNITPIFCRQIISLSEIQKTITQQKTMDFLLDNFRFIKSNANGAGEWYTIIDFDTDYKLAIMENYPDYEQEMIDYFGEKWFKHYIRFNH